MTIIRQIPWTEQPQSAAELDHTRWPGLTCVWVGSQALRNLVTGAPTSIEGSVAIAPGLIGPVAAISSGASNGVLLTTNPDSIFSGSTATISVVRRCRDTTNRSSTLFGYNAASSNRVLVHAPFSDGNIYFDFGSDAGSNRVSTSFTKSTQWEVLTFVAGSARGREIWRNGLRIASAPGATGARPSNGGTTCRIGATNADAADYEDVALFVVSSSEWTEQQIRDFGHAPLVSPWQLFAPRIQRVWAASLGGAYTLNAETGVYTFTGSNATLLHNYALTLESASYSLTGSNATLLKGLILDAASGSYTLTGSNATLVYNKLLNASSGSYSVTGADANLIYTPTAGAYVLNAESGAYALTGSDVTFSYSGGTITLKAGSWIRYRIIT